MDIMEKVEKTELLGRDFLVWLWFRSETNHGMIELGNDKSVEVLFDGKITLESEIDEAVESVTCSGNNPRLKEARYALTKDKKVTKAAISLIVDEDEYSFMLDSSWMNYRSLKTPKVLMDDQDDPEGLFYEKAGLIEKAISSMDSVFIHFIKLRLSPEWNEKELPALKNWIQKEK